MNATVAKPRKSPIRDRRDPSKPVLCFVLPGRAENFRVSIGDYVASWKRVKNSKPGTCFVKGFQWFDQTREEILFDISRGVHDRINIRGGIVPPAWTQTRERRQYFRTQAALAATVTCECRWCGSTLPTYQTRQNRFCEGTGRGSCRAQYNS